MTTDPQKIYEELKLRQADIFAGVGIGAEPDVKRLLADNIPIPQYVSGHGIIWVPKGTPQDVIESMLKVEAGFYPITFAEPLSQSYPAAPEDDDPDDEYEGWIDGKNY